MEFVSESKYKINSSSLDFLLMYWPKINTNKYSSFNTKIKKIPHETNEKEIEIFIRITTVSTVACAQTALELRKNQEEELGRGAAVLGHAGKWRL